jgi:hypothetical protein
MASRPARSAASHEDRSAGSVNSRQAARVMNSRVVIMPAAAKVMHSAKTSAAPCPSWTRWETRSSWGSALRDRIAGRTSST